MKKRKSHGEMMKWIKASLIVVILLVLVCGSSYVKAYEKVNELEGEYIETNQELEKAEQEEERKRRQQAKKIFQRQKEITQDKKPGKDTSRPQGSIQLSEEMSSRDAMEKQEQKIDQKVETPAHKIGEVLPGEKKREKKEEKIEEIRDRMALPKEKLKQMKKPQTRKFFSKKFLWVIIVIILIGVIGILGKGLIKGSRSGS